MGILSLFLNYKSMKKIVLSKLLWLICICVVSGLCSLQSHARQKAKVLIVTGQNNHNWKVSHLAIQKILDNSGLFTADIAISPAKGEDMSAFSPDFSSYKLVVVDYNGDLWSEKMQENFLDYVQNGGGVVIYHAANNSFPQWKAYNEICALGGWEGRNEKDGPYAYWKDGRLTKDSSDGLGGSHGEQREYVLTARDNGHPIMKGLPHTWKHAKDELYDRMRGPANIATLMFTAFALPEKGGSGREEPLVFTVDYGKARIFHIMLGHAGDTLEDNPAMQCTGFQVLLLRGAEWAATGKVTQKVPADFPTEKEVSYRKEYK